MGPHYRSDFIGADVGAGCSIAMNETPRRSPRILITRACSEDSQDGGSPMLRKPFLVNALPCDSVYLCIFSNFLFFYFLDRALDDTIISYLLRKREWFTFRLSIRAKMAALQHRKRQQHGQQRGKRMDDRSGAETRQGQCQEFIGHVVCIEETRSWKKFRGGGPSRWRQTQQ